MIQFHKIHRKYRYDLSIYFNWDNRKNGVVTHCLKIILVTVHCMDFNTYNFDISKIVHPRDFSVQMIY